MNLLALFFIVYFKFCLVSSKSQCQNFQTCGQCISYTHETCVWCYAKKFDERRCNSKRLVGPLWCSKEVYDPIASNSTLSNENFQNNNDSSKTVQFRPQEMKIKARVNVPITFPLSYKPAAHYPLDVYYLLDSSDSMAKYKQMLLDRAVEIYGNLSRITNNVKLGVGSFIEKPKLPYVDTATHTAYSFRHHQKMTKNMTKITKWLKYLLDVQGTNHDLPQASFDALMQAMVCTREIGWRPYSRRIILVSTDATYHSVGDGRFGGAILPTDMKCQLEKNEYKNAITYDYPSVSQINKIATDTKTMIIFAANSSLKNDYEALAKTIKNVRYVDLTDKSNLTEMITDGYEELANNLQIEANTEPFMRLSLLPDCTKKGECPYVNEEQIDINATLTFTRCPTNNNYKYDVRIGPASIKEKLTLHVEVECQCDCEKSDQVEKDSDRCSKAGTYQCGICDCNENRYGETCDVECKGITTQSLDKCTAEKGSKPCSKRGTCSCGKCDCEDGFSGDFCEFDDNACPRPGGVMCSGHGACTHGQCECEPQWLPDDCRCPNHNQACIAPNSKKTCSGIGECECGKCSCKNATTNKGKCGGTYCDECGESTAGRCAEIGDYANCNLKEKKHVCDQKFNFSPDTLVILVNKSLISSPEWYMAKMWCRNVLEDGKSLVFRYNYYSSSNMRLIIQNELDLPPVANVWVTVGSVIGAILLIGIITLVVWKFLVDLHDKREYEKFFKESDAAGYDVNDNPLYQDPFSNFSNPIYNDTT